MTPAAPYPETRQEQERLSVQAVEHMGRLERTKACTNGNPTATARPRGVPLTSLTLCMLLIYMVGRDGIEPSTNGLKVHCSTAELTAPTLIDVASRKRDYRSPLAGEAKGGDSPRHSRNEVPTPYSFPRGKGSRSF